MGHQRTQTTRMEVLGRVESLMPKRLELPERMAACYCKFSIMYNTMPLVNVISHFTIINYYCIRFKFYNVTFYCSLHCKFSMLCGYCNFTFYCKLHCK